MTTTQPRADRIRWSIPGLMAVDMAMEPVRLRGRTAYEALDERCADLLSMADHAARRGRADEAATIVRHGMSTIRALRLEMDETVRDARGAA